MTRPLKIVVRGVKPNNVPYLGQHWLRCCLGGLCGLEAGDARGGGANLFGGAHAKVQALDPDLPERHQSGVQIAPNEEEQKRHGEVVLVLDRVIDGGGEIKAEATSR